MRCRNVILAVVGVCLLGAMSVSAGPEPKKKMDKAQKAKLSSLLKGLKIKAKKAEPVKYEVAIPVATAGVRGAEMRSVDRFAVLWPGSSISPLTALAENLQHDTAQGKNTDVLKQQLTDFLKSFPEFKGEKLLKDLVGILD